LKKEILGFAKGYGLLSLIVYAGWTLERYIFHRGLVYVVDWKLTPEFYLTIISLIWGIVVGFYYLIQIVLGWRDAK
jgi:hypothetical protein